MRNLSRHEQLRLKIVAYVFNRRVDALRGEMYRVLCLEALAEAGVPCVHEAVAALVADDLGTAVTDGLRTVVLDTLQRLVGEGVVVQDDSRFVLHVEEDVHLSSQAEQEQLCSAVSEELHKITMSIASGVSRAQISSLLDFYMEVADIVAQHQAVLLARGYGMQEPSLDIEAVSTAVLESRRRLGIDEFIDGDEFIVKSLVRPNEVLSGFLYRLIQVHVMLQMLTWDPALDYLEKTLLADRTLYLDSSILFALMQRTHGLHQFLSSLLKASRNDLGVRLRVHQSTLREYNQVMHWADEHFEYYAGYLREIAEICRRDRENPADYLEQSVFVDYLSSNLEHIDPGSWRRYLAAMTGGYLEDKLLSLSIEVDGTPVFVPEGEFQRIKGALFRASKMQAERSRKSQVKTDTTHDAKLYYWISSARSRTGSSEFSLGYDTYLITLDGSLTFLGRLLAIPFTETYFFFPNQWYELAFPFLRVRGDETQGVSSGLAGLAFSGAFPALASLIPLELCTYVFDHGGKGLPMGSIRNVVEACTEERLIECLDPASKDQRKREEAALRVQRIVVEETLEQRRVIEELKEETETLTKEHGSLRADVEELRSVKRGLDTSVAEREARLGEYDDFDVRLEDVQSQFEERSAEQEAKHGARLRALRETLEKKEEEVSKRDKRLDELEESLASLRQKLEEDQRSRQAERERTQERMRALRRSVVTALMLFGLLLSTGLLVQSGAHLAWVLVSILLMAIGLILYHRQSTGLCSFAVYSLGILVVVGVILVESRPETWQWVIPTACEILVLAVDRLMGRQTDE